MKLRLMKKKKVKHKLSVLVAVLALVPVVLFAQTSADSTSMWPNGTDLDFGYFEARGVERFDSLLLRNITDKPFIIENIRSSCGCTAVDFPKGPIGPGEEVNIPIVFRCIKGGYVEKHLDVFLSHLDKKERIYVIADCPARF